MKPTTPNNPKGAGRPQASIPRHQVRYQLSDKEEIQTTAFVKALKEKNDK
jgi:hypothetical protein